MSYTLPYTFVPGTKARAQEVNANFASVTDTLEIIDSSKANLDLSNITPEALEVIKNNSSIRNIGELIFSPIPLTDSNLHLLDGSILDGNGIYGDFVNHIKKQYNTDSRYNPDIFSITGNLSITSNGIASGFSQNPIKNIKLNQGINSTNYTICGEFTTPETLDTSVPFSAACTVDGTVQLLFSLRFDTSHNNGYLISRNSNGSTTNILTANNFFTGSTSYKYKIIVNGANVTLKINNETIGSINNFCELPLSYMVLGAERFNNEPFSGTIDLKEFSVIENDIVTLSGEKKCNYFTDEQTWQQSVSQYGECAKFVYNSTSNTVRLPKIRGLIEYTTATSELGDLTEAGLPNITGKQNEVRRDGNPNNEGALHSSHTRTGISSGTGGGQAADIYFDASWSNPIYGKSSTVQPQTVKYLVYIVVASTPKTSIQVDIDRIATDINGKLDKDLSNIEVSNIENFDGQWIYNKFEILSSATVTGNTGYQYDLSNYLPNNNKKYEVLFSAWGQTGASSGNGLYIWTGTDIIGSGTDAASGKVQILRIRAVNSYAQYGAGSVILPVGTGRKLYLYFSNNDNASGINIEALAYRRIGTNM